MGIVRNAIKRAAGHAADAVATLSALSPDQLDQVREKRDAYLEDMPDPGDVTAHAHTERLMAACGIEVYSAYLPQIRDLYVPVEHAAEYDGEFDVGHNVRYLNITKWVRDAEEAGIEKLVNVYEVLSDEECNIALVFHRTMHETQVYLAVVNTKNDPDNVDVDNYLARLEGALRGNFPGSEWSGGMGRGVPAFLEADRPYSVACASNIPAEKSERFASQTIERLLDGIVPGRDAQEYTIVLLATPVRDVESRKLQLSEIYSGLAPYASWQTNFTFNESNTLMSGATVGVNVGASAGVQAGATRGTSISDGETLNEAQATGENSSQTGTESTAHSEGVNETNSQFSSNNVNASIGIETPKAPLIGEVSFGAGHSWGESMARGTTVSDTTTKSLAQTVGKSVTNTLGKAVTHSVANSTGQNRGHSLGANFGMNFARTSNVSATVGKNEGITQSFTNYSVKHALETLERQMRRYEESSALGLWDFAAYVLSEDLNVANNVAHSYLALTQGEESYLSTSSVNLWRGDGGPTREVAHEICSYVRELRHPVFGLRQDLVEHGDDGDLLAYPPTVTATTALSGKELAYSLNFPRRSLAGLPVLECTEFGRGVTTFDGRPTMAGLRLGSVFHMRRVEQAPVELSARSLASHTFVTGSTGSGKSNTVYKLLSEASEAGATFLVVEPAKGEYKDVFGGRGDVAVYGTNPALSPLLRINPFSFPAGIHVLEHMDRLVEIFNVCWPMYAAMPAVLKQAVERSYEDCGWNLVTSANEFGDDHYPTFADVARNVRGILDESEYDAENKGAYKGSLLTRLQSLTNGINGMVFGGRGLADEELFDKNVVVDLSRVGSSETKSLLMGMLVLKLQEHRMSSEREANSGLRHITVLEEAHNLLRRTSTEQSADAGNLMGKSVEMLTNAIAEMRTYGEGFVIVDQAPGLLDMAAIRNTNTKIVMRLPDQGDRELVGYAAGLDDEQIRELAKLPQGVAAVYQNDWVEPVLCKVDFFEPPEEGYGRHPEPPATPVVPPEVALAVVELLCECKRVSDPRRLAEVDAILGGLGVGASARVAALRMLREPPAQPRMARLGPIVSELFPKVREAVRRAHDDAPLAPEEWTTAAAEQLRREMGTIENERVRRDIIQIVVTDLLYNELNDAQALQDWSHRGGLV